MIFLKARVEMNAKRNFDKLKNFQQKSDVLIPDINTNSDDTSSFALLAYHSFNTFASYGGEVRTLTA
jgi:hypothetical protein